MEQGIFFAPTLLLCRDPQRNGSAQDIEAFGLVSTPMPHEDIDEALALAAKGRGSLVATLATRDPSVAAKSAPMAAMYHGRLPVLDHEAVVESTGHGSPLPEQDHDEVRYLAASGVLAHMFLG